MKASIVEKVEREFEFTSIEDLEDKISDDFFMVSFDVEGIEFEIYYMDGTEFRICITDHDEIDIDQYESFDTVIELIRKYFPTKTDIISKV